MDNKKQKILLVDDEKDILEFLGYNLRKEGYEVYTSENGKDAIEIAKKVLPNLIILDIMMPGIDGVETCEIIRSIPELKNIVIVFLTARGEDYSQIAGFDAGADDYITKPIRPRVFLSRVKALLRRKHDIKEIGEDEFIEIGNIKIDKEKVLVYKENKKIILANKEFKLLLLLVSKPGKVFTRDEIFDTVWEEGLIVGDRTIDVHIRKLREKLETDYIKTIKGIGYKIEF